MNVDDMPTLPKGYKWELLIVDGKIFEWEIIKDGPQCDNPCKE